MNWIRLSRLTTGSSLSNAFGNVITAPGQEQANPWPTLCLCKCVLVCVGMCVYQHKRVLPAGEVGRERDAGSTGPPREGA